MRVKMSAQQREASGAWQNPMWGLHTIPAATSARKQSQTSARHCWLPWVTSGQGSPEVTPPDFRLPRARLRVLRSEVRTPLSSQRSHRCHPVSGKPLSKDLGDPPCPRKEGTQLMRAPSQPQEAHRHKWVVFWSQLLKLSTRPLRSIQLVASVVLTFLLLSSIPLCGWKYFLPVYNFSFHFLSVFHRLKFNNRFAAAYKNPAGILILIVDNYRSICGKLTPLLFRTFQSMNIFCLGFLWCFS